MEVKILSSDVMFFNNTINAMQIQLQVMAKYS